MQDLLVLRFYPETHVWLESLGDGLTEAVRFVIFGRNGVNRRA
jgi:hypothetical protein